MGELIEEIKKRARLLLGFSSDENSVEFLELRSNDSFLINSFDIISSVISDGDHLLLVDKKTLFDEKLQFYFYFYLFIYLNIILINLFILFCQF